MPNSYGFVEQAVAGGAGVVIAGSAKKKETVPVVEPTAQAQNAQPVETGLFLIPYTDKQSRVQYLENVRDFLNNELARIDEALRQERGY